MSVAETMREDWNRRAKEDAHYYVAFGRHEQDEAEFLATGADVLRGLRGEMKRGLPGKNPRARRALEIGCGPGRLMKPLSQDFGEIHGVDVSDEMIAIARRRLQAIPHAHPHVGSGADLRQFADESFDFIYSYAVFQHIPDPAVVMSYLRDAARVLKPGGLMRFQANNLDAERTSAATWHGCSISAEDVRAYAAEHGLSLLALEAIRTQYMWVTLRKPAGEGRPSTAAIRIRRITNSESSEPVAPNRGRYAALSLWVEHLPADADLLRLTLAVGGERARLTYLSPPEMDGLVQLNAVLPAGLSTGLQPLQLRIDGELKAESSFRIIPAPPAVPRLVEAVDGMDYLSGQRIISGCVKLFVEELLEPESLVATIDGEPAYEYSILCTDPLPPRHEINFRIAAEAGVGSKILRLEAGRRLIGLVPIEIAPAEISEVK
ncbi:methyltransferase domain-containing protein [Bryobacter aggregatus]|uniref:methyltransferase domain-containing protein n=1 Tax=Bryobacter aggregatus TaxID=360054 RepID=UPI00068D8FDF|nr:methyltransferase domain-containing protein [Bryobacter aggregatus]